MTKPPTRQPARREKKHPWLAVNLSLFFPGLGQIYAGHILKGIGFFLSQLVLIFFTVWSIFSPTGNTVTGLSLLLPIFGFYVFNLFDAHKAIKIYPPAISNRPPQLSPNRSQIKDPWFAVFLSQILPGLGHLYLEKLILGGIILCLIIILANAANQISELLIFIPAIYSLTCYHAYLTANKRTDKTKPLIAAVIAIIFTLKLTSTYLPGWIEKRVQRFSIPSDSMIPTLQIGDGILVEKSTNYQPKRGDIIVFRPPPAAQTPDVPVDTLFIKRVLGEPGQTLQVTQGRVYINNQPLSENYIAQFPAYEWGPQIIPTGSYLVFGDNRNDSFDSHVWGFLPADHIIGKAYKIYWPPPRIQPI